MIKVVFNKFSVMLIGLFLLLLSLKLTGYPNIPWTVVGLPVYGPPIVSGAIALYQQRQFKKRYG